MWWLTERKDRAIVSEGGGGKRREEEINCQASRQAIPIDTNDRGQERQQEPIAV